MPDSFDAHFQICLSLCLLADEFINVYWSHTGSIMKGLFFPVCSTYTSGSQLRGVLLPRGPSLDTVWKHFWLSPLRVRGLLVPSGYSPGTLSNILECTQQLPQQRILWSPMSPMLGLRMADNTVFESEELRWLPTSPFAA